MRLHPIRVRLINANNQIGDTGLHWCPIGSFTAVFSVDAKKKRVILERLFYMTSDSKSTILGDGGLDSGKR